jgi:HSP20 family protein
MTQKKTSEKKRTGPSSGPPPAEAADKPSSIIGGRLNLLGVQIDLDRLLESPGDIEQGLGALRERLKAAGGKERMSDEDWKAGGTSVTGFIRTGGLLGDQEYHVGTMGSRSERQGGTVARPKGKRAAAPPAAPEFGEPPLDLFDEGDEIRIVADVPGAELDDLELKAEGRLFSVSTRPGARRGYRRDVELSAAVDPAIVSQTCRNGVLEVRLRKA